MIRQEAAAHHDEIYDNFMRADGVRHASITRRRSASVSGCDGPRSGGWGRAHPATPDRTQANLDNEGFDHEDVDHERMGAGGIGNT